MAQEKFETSQILKEAAMDFFQDAFRANWEALRRGNEEDNVKRELKASLALIRSQDIEPYEMISAEVCALPPEGREEILSLLVQKFNLSKEAEQKLRTAFNGVSDSI